MCKRCEEEISNKLEEEKRRKCLIIFNVVEQGEDVDSGVREVRAKQFCEEIFAEKLNVSDMKVEKVIRIGKITENSNRTRANNCENGARS